MLVFSVIAVFAVMALGEGAPLYRRRWWRELAAVGVVWSLGLALSLAMLMNLPLPSPAVFMERIFSPLALMLKKVLLGL